MAGASAAVKDHMAHSGFGVIKWKDKLENDLFFTLCVFLSEINSLIYTTEI